MRELAKWPEPEVIERPKLWPDEWFDGRIVEINYGDEPWWPNSRDTESVRGGLYTIARHRGLRIRTQVRNNGYTIVFQKVG